MRFTIRDALWLMIMAVASFCAAVWSFQRGIEFAKASEPIELSDARYNLEGCKACLKKHGLEPRCADE